ncbi:MAG: hypothetical protein RAP03_09955 [Candidatus Electryonea clarkiae]|nr:hypothetical protein [Candidatus Electryonea clarkiae]
MSTEGDLKNLKRKVMSKKRTVIFDNDGGDVSQLCKGITAQDLINTRTKPAMDAGIDTCIYTTGGGLGIGLHDSKVGSVRRSKEGTLSKSLVADFTKNGTDCLRINSEYVKRLGKEFFWGMRMNDTHDAGYGGIFMPENKFKNDNPEVMFGKGIKHGAVTAVDYLEEKVRDFAVRYIMDVVDNYTIDGIFLDFFRHPIFFRSNANGLVATKEEIDAMNTFMRCVKSELDKRRMADETYYITSVRVPDSVEYCYAIGLDIETWLKDELTDILFTTSYMHLNDWTYSAKLAHKYNVPVYPSLDESRVKSELPRHKRNSVRGYYGRIMNVWDAGCDGVFMFNNAGLRDMKLNIEQNWFSKNAGTYQEGLATTVKGKEFVNALSKTYFVSFRGVGRRAFPYNDYINIPTLNHYAPILISKDKQVNVPIRISDDIKAASDQGKTPTVTVSIFMFGDPNSVKVTINDSVLDVKPLINQRGDLEQDETEYVLNADIPVGLIKTGRNVFSFNTNQKMTLLDMWVDLDYPEY